MYVPIKTDCLYPRMACKPAARFIASAGSPYMSKSAPEHLPYSNPEQNKPSSLGLRVTILTFQQLYNP